MSWGPLLLAAGAVVIVLPHGRMRLPRVPLAVLAARVLAVAGRSPRRAVLGGVGAVAGAGLLVGGPVGGVVAGAYAGLAARALLRRSARRRAAVARSAALDALASLAADLRAGLPPEIPTAGPGERMAAFGSSERMAAVGSDRRTAEARLGEGTGAGGPADRLRRLTGSVWRLAERTGAPAADLVERIEADARAADRAGALAAAQAAGAQATAVLLAALPAAGLGLGLLMGADPLHVLLRTPLGAACGLGAVVLQTAGLLWAERLVGGVAQ
ncbi:hypothetical protein [Actinoplanes sp. URMC 104]|uniref:hypothetical protein n=1 Tax=Actinoplanes sp. URMC 104 TaxID=3423409 RepID=UPI003F1C8235